VIAAGCKPPLVAPHLHKLSARLHPAMGASLPSASKNRDSGKVAAVKEQAGSSCNGHACSGATDSSFALAGTPLGFVPSEIGGYRGGRSVERARTTLWGQDLPTLIDDGTTTEDMLAWYASFGIRPRRAQASDGRNSDSEMVTINDEESFLDLETGAAKLIVGPYAIDPGASDMDHQVQAMLAAGIMVRIDGFVDTAYEQWSPSQPPTGAPDTSDVRGGGHAEYLVDYLPGGIYVKRGSWGTTAGDAGDFLVTAACLRAAWGIYPWIVRLA
jgi:hypothetical protein